MLVSELIRNVIVTAGSVVHYGVDKCFRIPVLRTFGFGVSECSSFPHFKLLLRSASVDAVLFPQLPTDDLVGAVHNISPAPLVYFSDDLPIDGDHRVDLAIPPLTKPLDWLLSIERLLKRTSLRPERTSLRAAAIETRHSTLRKCVPS
jgi:hypothetical protein